MLYFLSERIRHYIYLLTEIHGDAKKTLRTLKSRPSYWFPRQILCVLFSPTDLWFSEVPPIKHGSETPGFPRHQGAPNGWFVRLQNVGFLPHKSTAHFILKVHHLSDKFGGSLTLRHNQFGMPKIARFQHTDSHYLQDSSFFQANILSITPKPKKYRVFFQGEPIDTFHCWTFPHPGAGI